MDPKTPSSDLRIKQLVLCLSLLLLPNISHADITTGLVGWWKMDESGGDAVDSSVTGNTLTATGTTVLTNCKKGNCRQFNGTTDALTTTALPTTGVNNVSMGVWVYSTVATRNELIFYNGHSGANGYGISHTDASCSPGTKITILNGGSSCDRLAGAGPVLATNVWTHIVIVRDAGTWKLYVNGSLSTTGTSDAPSVPGSGMSVGSNHLGAGNFVGRIDDARIYSRALSEADVLELYNYSPRAIKLNNTRLRNFHGSS